MPTPKRPTKHVHTIARLCVSRPIAHHGGLGDLRWASQELRWTTGRIRKAAERAIRTRHHDAFIEHECHKTHKPHMYCLLLARTRDVRVYFTVEQYAILIRGITWDVSRGLSEHHDVGMIFW